MKPLITDAQVSTHKIQNNRLFKAIKKLGDKVDTVAKELKDLTQKQTHLAGEFETLKSTSRRQAKSIGYLGTRLQQQISSSSLPQVSKTNSSCSG